MKRLAFVVLLAAAAAAGVAAWVLTSQPEWYERIRYPLRYEAIVRAHARNYDLPPALLAAVIYTESKFDASARSDAGAVGLMQLLPETAKGIATRTGGQRFVVSDLIDPEIKSVTARGTCGTSSTATTTIFRLPSPPTTRDRGTSTPGGEGGWGSSFPKRART